MVSSGERDETGKHRGCTDHAVIKQIRELAGNYDLVRFTKTSQQSMDRLRLTRRGVLCAVCDYLDDGGVVDVTITDTNAAQIGNPMYVLHPTVDNLDIYVKVRIATDHDRLLIMISVHE